MNRVVVDASVAVKWFIPELHSDAAFRLLDGRAELHAPDFLLLEMDSFICRHVRRGLLTVRQGEQIRSVLLGQNIHRHSFHAVRDPAFALANATRRSPYDCLYLALAREIDGQMVTADERFYRELSPGPLGRHLLWVGDVPG